MSSSTPGEFDYDQGWSQWDDMKRFGPMSRHTRRLIWKLIADLPFTSVIDVGAGQGSPLAEIATRRPGVALAAVDLSPQALKLARRRLPQAEYHVLDITREALDRRFDLVICSDVIEHLEDDRAAVLNLRRMTRRWCLVATLQGRMRAAEKHVGNLRNYARGEVAGLLGQAGFRVTRVLEWGFPLYSPLYRDLLDHVDPAATSGRFGATRRIASSLLYLAFLLNSSRVGDYVFCLGEVVPEEVLEAAPSRVS